MMKFVRVECNLYVSIVRRFSILPITDRTRIKSGRHAYSGMVTVLTSAINLHKFYVRCAATEANARERKFPGRAAKILDTFGFGMRDSRMINRRYRESSTFLFLILCGQGSLNAPIVCSVHVVDHNERSFVCEGGETQSRWRLTKIFMERYRAFELLSRSTKKYRQRYFSENRTYGRVRTRLLKYLCSSRTGSH